MALALTDVPWPEIHKLASEAERMCGSDREAQIAFLKDHAPEIDITVLKAIEEAVGEGTDPYGPGPTEIAYAIILILNRARKPEVAHESRGTLE